MTHSLQDWGWTDRVAKTWRAGSFDALQPGRVLHVAHDICRVMTETGELLAEPSGRFHHLVRSRAQRPVVGDWVALRKTSGSDRAVLEGVLDRRSRLVRKIPGDPTEPQVVCANMDIVFVVCALDGGRSFNAKGLQRFLSLVRETDADPVVILNKRDLCKDVDAALKMARDAVNEVRVLATSALTGEGLEVVRELLTHGVTGVFTGLSGVGKSALINRLAGEEVQVVGEVRARDLRGRHTTTHRELLSLAGGGLVIDTPGLREIQLWMDEESLTDAFSDIEALSTQCRFGDCRHTNEPGCAVQDAIRNGGLDARRLENYRRMQDELQRLRDRVRGRALRESRKHRAVAAGKRRVESAREREDRGED